MLVEVEERSDLDRADQNDLRPKLLKNILSQLSFFFSSSSTLSFSHLVLQHLFRYSISVIVTNYEIILPHFTGRPFQPKANCLAALHPVHFSRSRRKRLVGPGQQGPPTHVHLPPVDCVSACVCAFMLHVSTHVSISVHLVRRRVPFLFTLIRLHQIVCQPVCHRV